MLGAIAAAALLASVGAITLAPAMAQGQPPIVRARGLIIVDDQGRERIIVGAPVPNPKEGIRSNPSTGFVINDPAGYERFGLGLFNDNRVVMGFDAPPGTGDDRNRERINVVADATGGAYLRFLNRKTGVVGRLVLDAADQFYLEFLDLPEGKVVSRRIGFKGEQTLEQAR
jgi:hypothetical protein